MFPHTITAFTRDEVDDSYNRELIEGVYWYGTQSRSTSGKGVEDSSDVTIDIPLSKFKGIVRGSIVVKGIHGDIESIKDLHAVDNCITVESIQICDAGSRLDHVIIKGV